MRTIGKYGRVATLGFMALLAVAAFRAEVRAQEPEEFWKEIEELFQEGDEFRIVERMADAADPETAGERYATVVVSLYYSGRNLPAVVFLAGKGIDFNLAHAVRMENEGNPEAARRFRGLAKALAYDLASFTWPGWDESGIAIRTADLETGLRAAQLNLRLAEELERGPGPMANAYFILGGHALAAGDYGAAEEFFGRFGQVAADANLRDLMILAEGYAVITSAASESGNPGDYVLEPVRERFRDLLDEGAEFWIEQLETAWNVFVTG